MAFDFEKAINGTPVYCNGKHIPSLLYSPYTRSWRRADAMLYGWIKDGTPVGNGGEKYPLSTDPPKQKVKKTVYINWYGEDLIYTYATEYDADEVADKSKREFQRIVTEIEVYE